MAFFLSVCTAFGWTSGALTVTVTNSPMDINVAAGGTTLADITGLTFGTSAITAISSVATTTDSLVLALSGNISVTIKTVQGGIYFYSTNPASIASVSLTLKDQNEHFYGITEHNIATSPDLRGKTVPCKIFTNVQSDEDAEAYSSFYFTSLGYAGFFNSFAYGSYSFGVSGKTTILHNTSNINWYLLYGPTLSKIQQSYYKIIGAPKKVPMWACGPLVWHDNFTGSAMMLAYADSFATDSIPYSTMWLDRPYNSGAQGWSTMDFGLLFSSPGVWIKSLTNDYYVNLVTWIMPGVFSGGAYPPGAFTSTTNVYLDLTDPTEVTWYKNKLLAGQYPYGVKGHKMDRVDNHWPDGAALPAFSDGTPEPERHEKYAFLNAKVTDEALRTTAGLGDDQFNFPRCAVAGCQQYISAIWNGDSYADFPGMQTCMGNAIRAGVMGFPMWGSDIGGYNQKGMPQMNNYLRWMEFGVYSGFMELMLDGKEPWTIASKADEDSIRSIFNLRFNLLPYIYSIINTSANNGVTMKPLFGEYPTDPATSAIWDEYLFGPSMLVAPIYSSLNSRSVYLPAGTWINLYDFSDVQTGAKSITTPTLTLEQIPVYIKSNSIYPTGKVFAGLEKKWNPTYDSKRTITLNAFPGAAGESNSFTYMDYVDGDKLKTLTVSVSANNVISIAAPAMTIPGTVVIRLTAAPTSVYLGSTAITSPQYDATAKKLTVPFVANQPISVGINGTPNKVFDTYEPTRAHGRMMTRQTDHGMELTIPRMTGIDQNNRATLAIFDMTGRNVAKKEFTLIQYSSTPVTVKLGKGTYLAKVEVGGIEVDRAKIIAH